MARIYVASSWRNTFYTDVVAALRADGHEVHDWRKTSNPSLLEDEHLEVLGRDDIFRPAEPEMLIQRLTHSPKLSHVMLSNLRAMEWADTGVLLQPCGRSAHLEIGYMSGRGKRTIGLLQSDESPDLMYLLMNELYPTLSDLRRALKV